jgi:hypothetical protein
MRLTDEERFWSKVDKTDGCWEWTGTLNGKGYGQIRINGRYVKAHRYSWILHNGNSIDGLLVCHKCDNTMCVRPEHLFLGTQSDNMRDCVEKNRFDIRLGEENPVSRLKNVDIPKIRVMLSRGDSLRKIARLFNVHHKTIFNISHNIYWRSV